jgi:putative ABC transport system ATP-binding protein
VGIAIRLVNVGHDYGRPGEHPVVHALQDVSLEVEAGEFVVLMGASGSGKSTLLNIIGAVERPTSGQVFLGPREVSAENERQLTEIRRSSLGFVFQFFNLIPTLTVAENIEFPLSLLNLPRAQRRARVTEVLERVELTGRRDHFPNELSGGEMQRVAIGRAIAHRPQLILADEPTGNLDSRTGTTILDLLSDIHSTERPTIVMATHSDVAARRGDSVIDVVDGRLAARHQ